MTEQKNIYSKIADVMSKVSRVPKNGYNSFHKYNYATESDLTESIRPILLEAGLAFFSNVLEQERDGEFSKVKMEFTLASVDSNEVLKSTYWGEGQDKGDKGLYKAYTGATKYFLMKTFLIPTGDDPEADHTVDERNTKQQPKSEPISSKQVGMLKALVKELAIHGKVEDQVIYDSLARKMSIKFADVTELNKQQASKGISILNEWKKEKILKPGA